MDLKDLSILKSNSAMTQITQLCNFAQSEIILVSSDPKINNTCKTSMEGTSTGIARKMYIL